MSLTDTLTKPLSAVLQREIPAFEKILECKQLTAGASQQTFYILCLCNGTEREFALRRAQPLIDREALPGQMPPKVEARLLQLAGNAGIPVPQLISVLKPDDELGDGYLMEWLEGETLGQRIVKSEALAGVRPMLARQCGQALAHIHSIPVDDDLRSMLPAVSPQTLILDTWDAYKALNIPTPMIDFTARWLLEHLPAQSRQTLVHGDFRNGNLMIGPDGICAVLDWELAQIGDPIRDLGWLCVNSWRFGRSHLPVGGFGTIDDLLEGYKSVIDIDITPEDLIFWQVFGSFWWSITTLCMASTWRSGETPSLERPVIGRRSSEGQMDCVNLIIPGSFDIPKSRELSSGAYLPMPAELIESVRKFLDESAVTDKGSQAAFLTKVASNSLGIAQRELLHGASLAHAEHKRLQSLLSEDCALDELQWKLVHQLRDGLPLSTPGLDQHLRQTVAGQLAIDQPQYSALAAHS